MDQHDHHTIADIIAPVLDRGTPQQIADTLLQCKKRLDSEGKNANDHLVAMFGYFPNIHASLCQRLATASTWADFDTIFDAVNTTAPSIKKLGIGSAYEYKKPGDKLVAIDPYAYLTGVPTFSIPFRHTPTTLAAGVMRACELFGTDPIRIRSMLVKFRNNGMDISSAGSQLGDSHSGKAISSMISAEQSMKRGA